MSEPTMTNAAIHAQIAAREAEIKALRDVLRARMPVPAPPGELVTMAVCEAAFQSGMSESQIRRLCATNPYTDHEGFGVRSGGRWRVVKHRFLEYLDARLRV